jgi:hypothetical protein
MITPSLVTLGWDGKSLAMASHSSDFSTRSLFWYLGEGSQHLWTQGYMAVAVHASSSQLLGLFVNTLNHSKEVPIDFGNWTQKNLAGTDWLIAILITPEHSITLELTSSNYNTTTATLEFRVACGHSAQMVKLLMSQFPLAVAVMAGSLEHPTETSGFQVRSVGFQTVTGTDIGEFLPPGMDDTQTSSTQVQSYGWEFYSKDSALKALDLSAYTPPTRKSPNNWYYGD